MQTKLETINFSSWPKELQLYVMNFLSANDVSQIGLVSRACFALTQSDCLSLSSRRLSGEQIKVLKEFCDSIKYENHSWQKNYKFILENKILKIEESDCCLGIFDSIDFTIQCSYNSVTEDIFFRNSNGQYFKGERTRSFWKYDCAKDALDIKFSALTERIYNLIRKMIEMKKALGKIGDL